MKGSLVTNLQTPTNVRAAVQTSQRAENEIILQLFFSTFHCRHPVLLKSAWLESNTTINYLQGSETCFELVFVYIVCVGVVYANDIIIVEIELKCACFGMSKTCQDVMKGSLVQPTAHRNLACSSRNLKTCEMCR